MTAPKYQLHYFGVHGMCTPIRALLVIGNADWSSKVETFDTWPQVKASVPFGTLPVLNVTNAAGEVSTIPESMAIERYLAKKFGMAGSTDDEELQINVALSLHHTVGFSWLIKVLGASAEEIKKNVEEFKTGKLTPWIANCEKMLEKNGSNGHFVGDKITHADIAASTLMDMVLPAEGIDAILNEKTAPKLFACKRKVDSHPKYQAFRKSDEFTQMSVAQEGFVNKKYPYDMKKIHIVA